MEAQADIGRAKRIGVIFVHGVGEQLRFDHLDGEVRKLIEAIQGLVKQKPGAVLTVEIASTNGAQFEAAEDSWRIGPTSTVRLIVKGLAKRDIQLHMHEVWWADVNEPYSVAKQFRFWLWGLSVWLYPKKTGSKLPSASGVMPPVAVKEVQSRFWGRAHLFGVAVIFTALGYSIGIITFLLKRLLDIEPPDILKTITNYVSGVKLYNQRQRLVGTLFPTDDEFLDNVGNPPRVSIRRRMIRAIAEVACNDYDDWFVLAHSLGSVAAFNGLMETSYSWPGYFNESQWDELKQHNPPFAGLPRAEWTPTPGQTVPPRPAWVGREIAYRKKIFANFRGLFTYGSPLEKFANIWPARVPISRVETFSADAKWINVFDPIDPISGVLKSFSVIPETCCPSPINIGYTASPILLMAHLGYLTPSHPPVADKPQDMVTAVAQWLIGTRDAPGTGDNVVEHKQYAVGSVTMRIRYWVAVASWLIAFVALIGLGAVFLPYVADALTAWGADIEGHILAFYRLLHSHSDTPTHAATLQSNGPDHDTARVELMRWYLWALLLTAAAILMPLLAGLFAVMTRRFQSDPDDISRSPPPRYPAQFVGKIGATRDFAVSDGAEPD